MDLMSDDLTAGVHVNTLRDRGVITGRVGDEEVALVRAGDRFYAVGAHGYSTPQASAAVSGQPLQGPVAWYGPIVMNTQVELRQAFEELEQSTFLKQEKRK